MPTAQERLTAAIQAGHHGDRDELARAAGVPAAQVSTVLALMRRRGVVEYTSPTKIKIDYASLRVVGTKPQPDKSAAAKLGWQRARGEAPPPAATDTDRLMVDASALRRLQTYASALSDECMAILGSPSLAIALSAPALAPALARALAGLLGSVEPVQVARKAPAPKAARKPRKAKPVESIAPRYKTVSYPDGKTKRVADLAEFCALADAERALAVDKRAHKVVEIKSGKVVAAKKPILPPDPRQPADEEE